MESPGNGVRRWTFTQDEPASPWKGSVQPSLGFSAQEGAGRTAGQTEGPAGPSAHFVQNGVWKKCMGSQATL